MGILKNFLQTTGVAELIESPLSIIMIVISCVLLYLGIVKKYEPLLLIPIATGMLLTNLPGVAMYNSEIFACTEDFIAKHPEIANDAIAHGINFTKLANEGGLLDFLYLGVKLNIYPFIIFMGIGAMTDFSPLISNPKSLLLGAAAQLGIFITYLGARFFDFIGLIDFSQLQAAAIGIIGGADGPTSIFLSSKLAPELLAPIAIAAYSYMALVPLIQPPIMRLLTTKKERQIKMTQLRPVSKTERIIFPISIIIIAYILLPSAVPLVGALMFGNILKESGVCERLSQTLQNELLNIVTIFLGISVGATAVASNFLKPQTLGIIALGLVAFSLSSAGGVLFAKLMNLFSKNKINPLIGSAGVSAVPMAARVSQKVGQEEDPSNFLLMHAMGPNVAGVIGSAVAAGIFLSIFA
jgi:oxaloacetate decarboxylase beta subunit